MKVVITIEDLPNGKVKVTSEPTFEVMSRKVVQGVGTSAEGYALFARNKIKAESQSKNPDTKIIIPRIHGG